MVKFFAFIKKRIVIIFFLFLYIVFGLITYKDYGMTMDEYFVYARGQYFYTKVRGNDPQLQKAFAIKEGNNENLLYYNSSYSAILYALNKDKTYESFHLLNLLFASVIFLFMYEILLFLYKRSLLAIIGPLILFFTPRFLGAIPANPKDIPFAIFYFFSLISMFLLKSKDEKIRILIIGLLIGLTTSLRFIGFSLIPIYFIYLIILSSIKKDKNLSKMLFHSVFELLIISTVACLFFLINMPYVATDPFNHLIELIQISKNYPWNGEIVFFGQKFLSEDRPYSYLFVWLIFTTPLFILFFPIFSIFKIFTGEKNQLRILLYVSILFQLILYTIFDPILYNGLRHYLFLVPQLVLLTSMTTIELLGNQKIRNFIFILIGVHILAISIFYFKFHPYEYVYFNFLIGGNSGAQGKFRLDYWAASDKEALLWLKNYLKNNNISKTRVYTCSKSDSLNAYLKDVKNSNKDISKANYIVCYDYFQAKDIIKKLNVILIHEVKRNGVPVNYIYKQIK